MSPTMDNPGATVRRRDGGVVPRPSVTDAAMAAVLVAAMVLQVCPGAQDLLEFDRAGIAAGQVWRLVTCNLVHFGWAQLFADTAGLAVLWWICRRRGVPTVWPMTLGLLVVGPAVWVRGGVEVYRGLSGVNCALVAAALADAALSAGRVRAGAGWWALLALLGARSVYELITGRGIGPTSLPAGICIAGAAHLAGLAVGVGARVYEPRGAQG